MVLIKDYAVKMPTELYILLPISFPFAFARNVRIRNSNQLAFVTLVFVAFIFQLIDLGLYEFGIMPHYWLYHIITPIGLGFTIYILITLYPEDKEDYFAALFLAIFVTVTVYLIDLFTSYKNTDELTTFISSSIGITMGAVLFRKSRINDYRLYIILAFFIDGVMNVFSYPQFNQYSYIITNFLFFTAILIMWIKNE